MVGHILIPSTNEKLQSRPSCHFFYPVFHSRWELHKGVADEARPFPTQTHSAGTKSKNGSTFHMFVSSKAIILFPTALSLSFSSGKTVCQIKWWRIFSVIMWCLGRICRLYVVLLRHADVNTADNGAISGLLKRIINGTATSCSIVAHSLLYQNCILNAHSKF